MASIDTIEGIGHQASNESPKDKNPNRRGAAEEGCDTQGAPCYLEFYGYQ